LGLLFMVQLNYRTLSRFIERSGLPFKPYDHFKKADLEER
jgi:hypothetical protein